MGLHPDNKLTPRETAVVRLVAEGESNAAIADKLKICEGSVKNYVSLIFDKIGCSNRVQCALWWIRLNDDREDRIVQLEAELEKMTKQYLSFVRRLR